MLSAYYLSLRDEVRFSVTFDLVITHLEIKVALGKTCEDNSHTPDSYLKSLERNTSSEDFAQILFCREIVRKMTSLRVGGILSPPVVHKVSANLLSTAPIRIGFSIVSGLSLLRNFLYPDGVERGKVVV